MLYIRVPNQKKSLRQSNEMFYLKFIVLLLLVVLVAYINFSLLSKYFIPALSTVLP